jgi:hypothetical protein
MKRNRILYFLLVVLVIFAGLLSRKIAYQLPYFVNLYLGDTLWALMVFLIAGFLFPKSATMYITLAALSFCFLIEISQLYHANWIDAIRQTTLGGLILGYGFLWTDLLAYSAGVAAGSLLEKLFLKTKRPQLSS